MMLMWEPTPPGYRNTISVGSHVLVRMNTPREQSYCSTDVVFGPFVTEHQYEKFVYFFRTFRETIERARNAK